MCEEFQTGWIEERLRELGKPKNGLAKVIGQAEPRATGIISGTRQIKARELAAISRYLELPVDEILRRCCGDPGYVAVSPSARVSRNQVPGGSEASQAKPSSGFRGVNADRIAERKG